MLDLFKKIISINSVCPAEHELSKFMFSYLTDLGFKLKEIVTGKDRINLIATIGKADKYLAFYSHLDTVPPDPNFKTNPFNLIIKDGLAKGLGASDMKGGLVCILEAAKWAVKENQAIKIILGVDEENISEGANDLVDSGLLSDINFLIAAESGQYSKNAQSVNLIFGRKGRIVFDLKVFGKSAHAADRDKGVNAIEAASRLITELSKITFDSHEFLGSTDIIVEAINAEANGLSLPTECNIRCTILSTPLDSSEAVAEKIINTAKEIGAEIELKLKPRKTPYSESYQIDLEEPIINILQNSIFIPQEIESFYCGSVADENVFANRLKIPVISLGPRGGACHTAEEWVDLKSMGNLIEIYKQIIAEYNANFANSL